MESSRTIHERARLGETLTGVFIFDAHMHLGEWHQFYMPGRDPAAAVKVMDRIGIACGIASAHGAAIAADLRAGNDLVIAATAAFPGRLHGYVVADPNFSDVMTDEIERCAKAGLRAIKVHSWHGKPYDADEYHPAYQIADSRSWPVLAHPGDDLSVFGRLAAKYGNVKWILAHAASGSAGKFCELARKRDNVFLDTCGSPCEWNQVETLVRLAGADKVLFGSDMVFLTASQQIGRILFARIGDNEKELILGLNARRVFNLPEPSTAKPQ
jgi:hypothetical protein